MAAAAVGTQECRWCGGPRTMMDGALWCVHCDIVHPEPNCEHCRTIRNRHDVLHDYHGPTVVRSDWAVKKEEL